MFCPNCGAELPDNSKFCSGCGATLEAAEETTPVAPEQPAEAPAVETPVPPVSYPAPEVPTEKNVTIPGLKMAFPVKKIVAVVAAIAILVGAIFGVTALFSGGKKPSYVYLSDESYSFAKSLSKDAVEFADAKSDDTTYSAAFSEDGKYFYYYTKYDYETYSGTLCRAEVAKLSKKAAKNEKYITTIGTKVHAFEVIGKKEVVYQNNDGDLYYFNGKEAKKIDKDTGNFYVIENNQLVYTKKDDGKTNLMHVSFKKIEEKTRLAKDIHGVVQEGYDEDNAKAPIFFTKYNDDNERELYSVKIGAEPEKLGESTGFLNYPDDKKATRYFLVTSDKKGSYADYVTDSKKDADAKVKQPSYDDFKTVTYDYDQIWSSYYLKDESQYDLYTSCTEDLYLLGCSMEEALNKDFGTNTTAMHSAIKAFIDAYGSTADEDGYIKVTSNVKTALKKIHAASSYSKTANRWLWLCYDRSSYTSTDYDAYYAAEDLYEEAQERNQIRDILKDNKGEFPLYTLYSYKDGKTAVVLDNILTYNSDTFNGALEFTTVDSITEKMDIEEFEFYYYFSIDAEYVFNSIKSKVFPTGFESNQYYLYETAKSVKLSEDILDLLEKDDESEKQVTLDNIYTAKDCAYLLIDGELIYSTVSGDTLNKGASLAEDVKIRGVYDNKLYFFADCANVKDSEYDYEGTLSIAEKDKVKAIKEDAYVSYLSIFEDGSFFFTSNYKDRETSMADKNGKVTVIGEKISYCYRIDKKTILYVSDGDLYKLVKDKSERVANDVDALWVSEYMESDYI